MAALEERLTRSIEYSTAIEQRLFDLQLRLPSTILRRWLGCIPGLRPAYHFVRRIFAMRSVQPASARNATVKDAEIDNRPPELCT